MSLLNIQQKIITSSILFEIAEIFPHCLVFEKDGKICLQEAEPEGVTKTEALSALTDLMTLEDGRLKLSGYNQEGTPRASASLPRQPFFPFREPDGHDLYR